MHMTGKLTWSGWIFSQVIQFIENSAVFSVLRTAAHVTQFLELLFKQAKFLDPMRHMPNVIIQQRIDFTAALVGGIPEPQQNANLVQGHIQTAAMAYE